jgi:hypothetical protein
VKKPTDRFWITVVLVGYFAIVGALLGAMVGIARADSLDGKALHLKYCASCHVPYPAWVFPQTFFDVKWGYMLRYITQFGATPAEVAAIKEYVESQRKKVEAPTCPHTGEVGCQ